MYQTRLNIVTGKKYQTISGLLYNERLEPVMFLAGITSGYHVGHALSILLHSQDMHEHPTCIDSFSYDSHNSTLRVRLSSITGSTAIPFEAMFKVTRNNTGEMVCEPRVMARLKNGILSSRLGIGDTKYNKVIATLNGIEAKPLFGDFHDILPKATGSKQLIKLLTAIQTHQHRVDSELVTLVHMFPNLDITMSHSTLTAMISDGTTEYHFKGVGLSHNTSVYQQIPVLLFTEAFRRFISYLRHSGYSPSLIHTRTMKFIGVFGIHNVGSVDTDSGTIRHLPNVSEYWSGEYGDIDIEGLATHTYIRDTTYSVIGNELSLRTHKTRKPSICDTWNLPNMGGVSIYEMIHMLLNKENVTANECKLKFYSFNYVKREGKVVICVVVNDTRYALTASLKYRHTDDDICFKAVLVGYVRSITSEEYTARVLTYMPSDTRIIYEKTTPAYLNTATTSIYLRSNISLGGIVIEGGRVSYGDVSESFSSDNTKGLERIVQYRRDVLSGDVAKRKIRGIRLVKQQNNQHYQVKVCDNIHHRPICLNIPTMADRGKIHYHAQSLLQTITCPECSNKR